MQEEDEESFIAFRNEREMLSFDQVEMQRRSGIKDEEQKKQSNPNSNK